MVTTARTAMRSNLLPMLPKTKPLLWVLKNKIKVSLGRPICFNQVIDYGDVADSPHVERTSYLNQPRKVKLQLKTDPHYVLKEFYNR